MADLVTLAALKRFLATPTSNQDPLIEQLIPRESRAIEQYTSRRFPSVTNTAKRLNGTGSSILVLPDSPILSIALLEIGGVAVAESPDGLQAGYTFDDTAIYLTGGAKFPMGRQNVTCTWTAGYEESETDYIPEDNPATLEPTTGGAASETVGVVNAAGTAFARVASSPAAGQYSFADGVYTFATADAGTLVTMTYRYIPGPVAQAAIEMVGTALKTRDNLGISSKTLAGESVSFSDRAMSRSVQALLQPYRRITPC